MATSDVSYGVFAQHDRARCQRNIGFPSKSTLTLARLHVVSAEFTVNQTHKTRFVYMLAPIDCAAPGA